MMRSHPPRQKSTARSVLLADLISKTVITAGGVGTIVAVLGVCLFLLAVALPLFQSAQVSGDEALERIGDPQTPLAFDVDEYRVLSWSLTPDGTFEVFHLASGERLGQARPYGDRRPTAVSSALQGNSILIGFADGLLALGKAGFKTRFLKEGDVPAEIRERLAGPAGTSGVPFREGVLQRTPEGQYRWQSFHYDKGIATVTGEEAVLGVAEAETPEGLQLAYLTRQGVFLVGIEEEESFLTGETTQQFSEPVRLPWSPWPDEPAAFLAISAGASDVYLASRKGRLARIHIRPVSRAFEAESGWLFDDEAELTALQFTLGQATLVWGDSKGRVRAGFLLPGREAPRGHGLRGEHQLAEQARFVFAETKQMDHGEGSSLSCLASSRRSRILLCGYADGVVYGFNVTSASLVTSFDVPGGEPVVRLAMAPKEDGLVALTPSHLYRTDLDLRYPEASFSSLFRPVWYEGYARPQYLWQSSSASDDFEPKMSLMPLIFGTLKATLYSMLFGAPLALLAAIFSSEFLHPRVRAGIKPTIELMASLPSVVLGFLAALVIAPFVEQVVPAVLTLFVAIPLCLLTAAYVWQMLPRRFTLPLESARVALVLVPVLTGVLLAWWLGPHLETALFGGDIKGWLSWRRGPAADLASPFASATGGWMLLVWPLSGIPLALLLNRFFAPLLRRGSRRWGQLPMALLDVTRFAVLLVLTLGAAFLLSAALSSWGFDPRGSYLDTYDQRNALVVGLVMGFAIIPIIYTLADDALSTVPGHLRGASLGAGATRWQTAMRVVIPAAMSGLFSALMIGLGRAVGETMIVLMAAGNTPVMSWNIFEGFRTLSANIAVELPEAVQGSTHYRTLFLAAVVLFVLTFIVNTTAELVRLRFRKRAASL